MNSNKLTLTKIIDSAPISQAFMANVAGIPLRSLFTYEVTDAERRYETEDCIELFNMAARDLLHNPASINAQNEMKRCLKILLHHIKFNERVDLESVMQMLITPYQDIMREELFLRSAYIVYTLVCLGEFTPQELIDEYRFLRRSLEPFNVDLDDNVLPIRDDVFTRYQDLLLQRATPIYNEELDFYHYVLFE